QRWQQGYFGLPLSCIVRDSHGALEKVAQSVLQRNNLPGEDRLTAGVLARILDFRDQPDLPANDRAGMAAPHARLLPESRRADVDHQLGRIAGNEGRRIEAYESERTIEIEMDDRSVLRSAGELGEHAQPRLLIDRDRKPQCACGAMLRIAMD